MGITDQKQMNNSTSEANGLSLISPQDQKIYSVGISTGGSAEIKMARGHPNRHIVATTIDPRGANFALQEIEKEQLFNQIEVKIEDVAKPLPYEGNFFDFIYARLVLHYLSKNDLKNALQELNRVLKNDGKIFVVVRSKDCFEAKKFLPDPETGLTMYLSTNDEPHSRYFHDKDSISQYLTSAGFYILYTQTYDEQLCIDFERTKLSEHIDKLVEVYASKSTH